MSEHAPHTPSDLDARADSYVRDVARLNPLAATDWGLPGDPGALPDYSPAGQEQMLDLARALVTDAQRITPVDEVDRTTASAIVESLGAEIDLEEADEWLGSVNNIASPIQDIRMSFDLMDKDTAGDWGNIARRLHAVPEALAGYQDSLRLAASRGRIAARRQIGIGIEQARGLAAAGNFFSELADEGAALVHGDADLERDLREGAVEAASAYGGLAQMLGEELLDHAPTADGIGRERYARFSRASIGAVVDLDETYEWGLAQLAEIDAQQRAIAEELYGAGTGVREALDRLNDEPSLQLHGTDALREWMQGIADGAIADLDGTQFDIPAPARRIECMIAPSQDGGIYYTGPSQDFSRPGRMWWAVPEGETTFHTWQERTTVFHEGVPGHHLQISQAIASRGPSTSTDAWPPGTPGTVRAGRSTPRASWPNSATRTSPPTAWACWTPCVCARRGSRWTSASTWARSVPEAAGCGTATSHGPSSRRTSPWPTASWTSSSTATWAGPGRRPRTRSVSACGNNCAQSTWSGHPGTARTRRPRPSTPRR